MKEYIGTVAQETNGNLETLLGFASLCLNQTVSFSTGFSPQELLYGVKATLMEETFGGGNTIQAGNADDLIEIRLDQLRAIREAGKRFNLKNKQKAKERYDLRNKAVIKDIDLGDKVWVRVFSGAKHKQKDKL